MVRNTLIATALLLSIAAVGCDFYTEDYDDDDDSYSYCDDSGCYWCDEWGCYPEGGPGGEGWACANNYDCAAGCYCDEDGTCQEAGFCTYDTDCPEGFECDSRSSCVPDGTDDEGVCDGDEDCPVGSICDEDAGQCVESWECTFDSECGPGWECDETRGTCVPAPPPPSCASYTDEDSCVADQACDAVYRGINCTDPDGESCTSEEANCTCERFVFHECIDAP